MEVAAVVAVIPAYVHVPALAQVVPVPARVVEDNGPVADVDP